MRGGSDGERMPGMSKKDPFKSFMTSPETIRLPVML
jgi:hypothetical protein